MEADSSKKTSIKDNRKKREKESKERKNKRDEKKAQTNRIMRIK